VCADAEPPVGAVAEGSCTAGQATAAGDPASLDVGVAAGVSSGGEVCRVR